MKLAFCATAALSVAVNAEQTQGDTNAVDRVIKLLGKMKTDTETGGKKAATEYDKVACHCKDSTDARTLKIGDHKVNIEQDVATMKSQDRKARDQKKIKEEQKALFDKLEADKKKTVVTYEKENEERHVELEDLLRAQGAIDDAIEEVENSKPTVFLSTGSKTVKKVIALANAVSNDIEVTEKLALLQNPREGYTTKTSGVVGILKSLKSKFDTNVKSKQGDDKAADKAHDVWMVANKKASDAAELARVAALKAQIQAEKAFADAQKELGEEEEDLLQQQKNLKILTEMCESSAKAWDQQSTTRAGELKAIEAALEVLDKGVERKVCRPKAADFPEPTYDAAQKDKDAWNEAFTTCNGLEKAACTSNRNADTCSYDTVKTSATKAFSKSVGAFLETTPKEEKKAIKAVSAEKKVEKKVTSFIQTAMMTQEQRQISNAVATIAHAAKDLKSTFLYRSLLQVEKIKGDPFGKVKNFIQQLIQRLLEEGTAEENKKGFCDTEMGKAEKDRDYAWADVKRLAADHGELDALLDATVAKIAQAVDDKQDAEDALEEAQTDRDAEMKANRDILANAKDGKAALEAAIKILSDFYRTNAKNEFDANDVDSKAGSNFAGSDVDHAMQGKGAAFNGGLNEGEDRNQSNAVISALEDILVSLNDQITVTSNNEADAHAQFVKFKISSEADISAFAEEIELNKGKEINTRGAIRVCLTDLQTATDSADKAIQRLETLNPTCVDMGQSFEQAKQAKEDEIKALKTARCQLCNEATTTCEGCSKAGKVWTLSP